MSDTNEAAPASLRDAILAADDVQKANFFVKEWDVTVVVKAMTGAERDAFDRETMRLRRRDKNKVHHRERLVIACTLGQDGSPVFKAADVDALAAKGVKAVDRLYKVCAKLNGFVDDDEDDAGN